MFTRISLVMLALILAVTQGCDRTGAPAEGDGDAPRDKATENRDRDTETAQWIKEKSANAKSWLNRNDTLVWEGSKEETLKLVDLVMGLGATDVLVVDMEQIEKGKSAEVANMFVVVLPSDAAKRAAVIKGYNDWAFEGVELSAEEKDEYLVVDTGQKYIVLEYD